VNRVGTGFRHARVATPGSATPSPLGMP
jgi:hypothetical protein